MMKRISVVLFSIIIAGSLVHCPLAKLGKLFGGADDAAKAVKHSDTITDAAKTGKAGAATGAADEATTAGKNSDGVSDMAGDAAGVGADIVLESEEEE